MPARITPKQMSVMSPYDYSPRADLRHRLHRRRDLPLLETVITRDVTAVVTAITRYLIVIKYTQMGYSACSLEQRHEAVEQRFRHRIAWDLRKA